MGPRRLQQMVSWAHGSGVLLHSPLLRQKKLPASHRKHRLGREGTVQGKERQDVLLGTQGGKS